MPSLTWQQRATCRNHDPETFFPDPSDTPAIRHAEAICRTCPVTHQCANHAKRIGVTHGVFAGQFHDDRSTNGHTPCGTFQALRRHRKNGEHCQTCLDADKARRTARSRNR